MKYKKV